MIGNNERQAEIEAACAAYWGEPPWPNLPPEMGNPERERAYFRRVLDAVDRVRDSRHGDDGEYERLKAECCTCEKCGHVQAEPNWCHKCGHRTTMPDWAKPLVDAFHGEA